MVLTTTPNPSGPVPPASFDITFPDPSNYWVACGWNNLTWKSLTPQSPPSASNVVTIMLTNSNKTLLNDDFEIGNALQGSLNAAMVYVPCIAPASGYSLLFVNSTDYDHKENKVLYKSPQFVIKPKGSAPDPASGQTAIPSQIQPYLQTPGIVLPQNKTDGVTNTTASGNNTSSDALPKLDASGSGFGSFTPTQHTNGAAQAGVWGDFLFILVIAAFTALIVTS
ncbi:uncharacterized protein UDID_03285 [Ustilago sp. UG-2017a]|nr:uncharacterized protein UDID_03285 [Ustilago sp. UG-2017a]SPC61600.1 uncharacterized protein UHOD_03285 [Ustilago sp. UG-2017b]